MTVDEKEQVVRNNRLCRNCLRRGHLAKECSSESSCRKCKGRHHTQLCYTTRADGNSQPPSVAQSSETSQSNDHLSCTPAMYTGVTSFTSTNEARSKVLLATAIVIMVDDNGTQYPVRALLDSGSECCFATERIYQRMKVHRSKVNLPIAGIGAASTRVHYKFQITIKSRVSSYATRIEAFVLPKVTVDLPSISIDASNWTLPSGIQLADPSFYQSGTIDVVLGAEVFFDLFSVEGRISLGESLPPLVNSVFGWVVSGKTHQRRFRPPLACNDATIVDIQRNMERFWAIEDDSTSVQTATEAYCEKYFSETVTRCEDGRYMVQIPFKEDVLKKLQNKRRTALHRYRFIENRYDRDPK
ncbi:uncharacterized protein LOC134222233 [Armigeres subalbatus]|uniref:uncharacterized protein LOC134222233 n=1 Tax=Armigeres subalbatus TaxID=124917 RepID=UPI002ED2ADA3